MTTFDPFLLNIVFLTPDGVPPAEHVFLRKETPEARVAIVAQPDGLLRFEINPASGAPALKQVAPELPRGCHYLLGIRHQNGKTRIKLAEVGYQGRSEQVEAAYDYEGARALIANLFKKD